MKIYTKHGDAGMTSLANTRNVAKSDARVCSIGSLEELSSHIGLVRHLITQEEPILLLDEIGGVLRLMMTAISDPLHHPYKVPQDAVGRLEKEMDSVETKIEYPVERIYAGKNMISAQIDIACAVARRAERDFSQVSIKYGTDVGAKQYLNRLADYLYMLARFYDTYIDTKRVPKKREDAMAQGQTEENLIQQVLLRMGQGRMTLESSKKLIQKIEEEAQRRGKQAVIAVCTPDGNPIAVHVMDGAFLVSFDVAVKKAYTAVAVKMSTMELSKLAQPGQTFYGVDKMADGKIVIFGGGIPLIYQGTIVGGLGISGGTGEEDHSLAEYALSILHEVL